MSKSKKRINIRCLLALMGAFLLVVGLSGCTRKFFRRVADAEVFDVIRGKDVCPQWKLENFHVYPDSRARFADPTNPDKPPMPPDDPGAACLAPNPQRPKHAGVAWIEGNGYLSLLAQWDVENRVAKLEQEARKKEEEEVSAKEESSKDDRTSNQEGSEGAKNGQYEKDVDAPRSTLLDPVIFDPSPTRKTPFLLTLEQAVNLGLINSREFQTRREDLYLTALPVTLQRFAFAAQFFMTEEIIRQRTGRFSSSGKTDQWRFDTGTGFTKLFSTGALLVFQFANETVINLTGSARHTVSVSDINLDIIQPFLRGGGRAVTLEPLTQTERNLLYDVRSYARFRKEFFVSIAGGEGLTELGGFGGGFGGGVVPGAFAGVLSPLVRPSTSGTITLAGGRIAPPAGYLPTLLDSAILTNQQKNVASLAQNLDKFRKYKEGGLIDDLQVNRLETQYQGSLTAVQGAKRNLQDSLDQLKLQLGIPPTIQLELDDTPIRPLTEHLEKYEEFFEEYNGFVKELDSFVKLKGNIDQLSSKIDNTLRTHPLFAGTKFREQFRKNRAPWQKLSDAELKKRWEELSANIQKLRLRRVTPREEVFRDKLEAEFEYADFELSIRELQNKFWKDLPQARQELAYVRKFNQVRQRLINFARSAEEERLTQLADTFPDLPPLVVNGVDLLEAEQDTALDVAARVGLSERLDLMNARAQVADAWRQLRIFANDLLGVLNVRYHFDASTPAGEAQPLAFSGARSRHQLFINGELPLVRKAERNNYRASLIALQRARRSLMAEQDFVVEEIRSEIRNLRLLAYNYNIQKRQIQLAYPQLQSAEEAIFAPVDPQRAGLTSSDAGTTNQLLSALSNLVGQQNQIYSLWVDYQRARLRLYRDLGRMQIDSRGVWIDEYTAEDANNRTNRRSAGSTSGETNSDQRPNAELLPPPKSSNTARLDAPR
ncbi:MAG: hypothetical protein ACFCD0_18060 [Gemmataceae bacterium]